SAVSAWFLPLGVHVRAWAATPARCWSGAASPCPSSDSRSPRPSFPRRREAPTCSMQSRNLTAAPSWTSCAAASVLWVAWSTPAAYSLVSQHLQLLFDTQTVVRRAEGHRIYQLDAVPLRVVRDWAAAYEQFWEERLHGCVSASTNESGRLASGAATASRR